MDAILANLRALAKSKAWSDDEEFNAHEFSGGNFDDAYAGGTADGEIMLAREILAMIEAANADSVQSS